LTKRNHDVNEDYPAWYLIEKHFGLGVNDMGLKYSIDGNQVCATDVQFKCLATCSAGFGDSLKEAFIDYYKNTKEVPVLRDCHPWELDWALEKHFEIRSK